MQMSALLLLVSLAAQATDQPRRGYLLQILDRPVDATFISTKQREDLQICVVDTIPSFLTPVVMDAGERATLVAARGSPGAYAAAITLRSQQTGTFIEVRAAKAIDDRIIDRLKDCF